MLEYTKSSGPKHKRVQEPITLLVNMQTQYFLKVSGSQASSANNCTGVIIYLKFTDYTYQRIQSYISRHIDRFTNPSHKSPIVSQSYNHCLSVIKCKMWHRSQTGPFPRPSQIQCKEHINNGLHRSSQKLCEKRIHRR